MIMPLCEKCKSCDGEKCTDYFEPGILYACLNFLERDNEDKQSDNQR